MHWINMALVTSVTIYPPSPLNGNRPVVCVYAAQADYPVYREEFATVKRAEEFARSLVNSEGWVDVDLVIALSKETQ